MQHVALRQKGVGLAVWALCFISRKQKKGHNNKHSILFLSRVKRLSVATVLSFMKVKPRHSEVDGFENI